ncbi:hypothetical protein FA13DRAFT_1821107 [Coprinellus micaceus]|uniref:Uncharacterized protein n=1 Tax=Coprinellus micaceus TaxID=71717 RepID=A0A4Y7SCB5_COPMI|nr:hypothetical protein FA13DRAFT_1821107 [Coprinellus micaceus]
MTTKFELCLCDAQQVLWEQLRNTDFNGQFNSTPYQQFDSENERVFSNLMSGDWSWREATKIYENDASTKGAMLVPVVSGLDKTTVSVATGSQDKRQKKRKDYQRFARQLYHECIAYIFAPLRAGMTTPEIVQCPDGHLRRAVYSIGPVIADYPEQVRLSSIVQGWCPKCLARPENLDDPSAGRRTHEKTDFAIRSYPPTEIWERFGIRDDVVPFTHRYPRADIHELMAPDLLHQLIKGTFKDHMVTWVNEYIHVANPKAKALEIIQDIDRRISGVPAYPGLRRFKDGRDFNQWTGDNSKALMKVYITAIAEYVPKRMVECLAVFMNICYILRRNAITASALKEASTELERFHELRAVFVEEGARQHISLPRQHALPHFIPAVRNFGSPNGLCSSITESRHITAMEAIRRRFSNLGMLEGTTSWYTAMEMSTRAALNDSAEDGCEEKVESEVTEDDNEDEWDMEDVGPVPGPRMASSVKLSQTRERVSSYPCQLEALAATTGEPQLVDAVLHRFWKGGTRLDTVLVAQSDEPGMYGMIVARLKLLFEFVDPYNGERHDCALVQWFPTEGDEPDPTTGMWVVVPEETDETAPLQVISLSSIVRGIHLLPVYGEGRLPETFCYSTALDKFDKYYVNHFIDHHAHELLAV